MNFVVIIPARFDSSRFPGKPLATLVGATGVRKTLIQRSWECARNIPGCRDIWVATDDHRIADEVRNFGGKVVLTSPECANGTERCAEAMRLLDLPDEIVVNLQGDAPLTPANVVPSLVSRLEEDTKVVMATPAVRCSQAAYAHLVADAAAGRVGGTTVVTDARRRALYFSKRLIPYIAPGSGSADVSSVNLHLGVYAYRSDALREYARTPPSELELLEGLEQLRFLDIGFHVSVLPVDPCGWDPIELNNPSDVAVIERILADRGIR